MTRPNLLPVLRRQLAGLQARRDDAPDGSGVARSLDRQIADTEAAIERAKTSRPIAA